MYMHLLLNLKTQVSVAHGWLDKTMSNSGSGSDLALCVWATYLGQVSAA